MKTASGQSGYRGNTIGAVSKGWFLTTGSSGDDPVPFSAQATQVRHYFPLKNNLRHDTSPVLTPAKLALKSEKKKAIKLLSRGLLASLGKEQMSFIKERD